MERYDEDVIEYPSRKAIIAKRVALVLGGLIVLTSVIITVLVVTTVTKKAVVEENPKNLILLLADGFGPASLTMAREGVGRNLTLDNHLVGIIKTQSADSIVTDSAAGATAYSCGLRTLNYQVAITPEGKACGTLFESAQKKGFKTGIVVTSEFTHATPASFASHAKSREMLQFIGEQMLQKRPDVLLGGGMAILKDKRNDERLYRLALERYQKILTHKTELHKDLDLPVFGIFADNHLNFTIDKSITQPSLASMTATTLDLLTKNKDDRFFLFIEGSRIDHAAHANDIAAHFHDILAFDETIKVLEDYVAKNPDTLVVVVADHETGGLTIGRDGIYQFNTDVLNSITRSLDFIAQFILQHPEPSMDVVRDALSRFSDIPWQLKYELLFPEPLNFNTITKGFSKIFAEETLAGWTTGGHTGVDINLFAFGPRSDDFRGVFRNDVVGRKLEKMFDLDLDAVTKELSEFNPNPSNAILTQDTIESHQH